MANGYVDKDTIAPWCRGCEDYERGVFDPPARGPARAWYLLGQQDARQQTVDYRNYVDKVAGD